jgi:hypothetical protein
MDWSVVNASAASPSNHVTRMDTVISPVVLAQQLLDIARADAPDDLEALAAQIVDFFPTDPATPRLIAVIRAKASRLLATASSNSDAGAIPFTQLADRFAASSLTPRHVGQPTGRSVR